MAHTHRRVGLLLLAWICATAAAAQPIYRCGNSYSQQPCDDAAPLQLQDARTASQQAEAKASAVRAGEAADRLEANRLKADRAAQQNDRKNALKNQSMHPATKAASPGVPKKKVTGKAPADDAPFIAVAPKPPKAPQAKSKASMPPAAATPVAQP